MNKKEIKLAIINSSLINENGWVCTGTESSDFSDELEILVNNIQFLLTQQHTKDIERFKEKLSWLTRYERSKFRTNLSEAKEEGTESMLLESEVLSKLNEL